MRKPTHKSSRFLENQREAANAASPLISGWHERGYLPHLKSENGTYFVTFRLADTLPKSALDQFRLEREILGDRLVADGELKCLAKERAEQIFNEQIDAYLDAGHGKCWLKRPDIGGMVVDALRHFEDLRYNRHAWVVMPNHVHAVLTPRNGYDLTTILQAWKSFTAHQAARILHLKNTAFWQRESYDHLVRNKADFERVCEYTIQNPINAGLCIKSMDWPHCGFIPTAWPPS